MTDYNDLYRLLKKISESSKNDSSTPVIDPSGGLNSNCCKNVFLDVPNGFQYLTPWQLNVMGELIGIILSKSLPVNTATSYAAFLNLIGQIIETYSSQQIYLETGPGRYYNREYANVANPFCSCSSKSTVNSSDTSTSESISKLIERMDKLENNYKELLSIFIKLLGGTKNE